MWPFFRNFAAKFNPTPSKTERKVELRQLNYFVQLARRLNYSQTAKELCITQSTLSQQIRKLEDELGVQLFARNSHHVQLTDVGQNVLPAAELVIHDANTCLDMIRDVQNLGKGELNIGTTLTFLPLLKETVLEFARLYPGVKLNIVCKSMEELMLKLEKEEIDVALSFSSLQENERIESHPLFDNNLCIVVSDTHPLAHSKSLRLRDVEKFRLALPSKGMQARETFDRMTEGMDLDMHIGLEINQISILMDIVRGSRFVTFLSGATVHRKHGLVAIPIRNANSSMKGCFHTRKDTYRNNATREFLKLLCRNKSFGMALMEL